MFHIHNFPLFLTTSALIAIIPGPAVFYITSHSAINGKSAGIASSLGVASGNLIHTTAAALGISALLLTFSWLFTAIKMLGALYLIFLGFQKLCLSNRALQNLTFSATSKCSLWRIYRDAVLVNIFNPKIAIFYLAFLPQFVDTNATNRLLPLVFLGTTFVTIALVSDLLYVFLSNHLSNYFRRLSNIQRWVNRITGGILIALGIRLATTQR